MTTPSKKPSDEKFNAAAKRVFDDSVDALDAATLSKLNRGRQLALAELNEVAKRPRWAIWAPAAGAAAAVLMVVMLMRTPGGPDLLEAPASDFELLLGEESIDMLEDLEFYSWLESADMVLEGEVG